MALKIKIIIRTEASGWQTASWDLAKRNEAFSISGVRSAQADYFCHELGLTYNYRTYKRRNVIHFSPKPSVQPSAP